jgi:hypothetical protein
MIGNTRMAIKAAIPATLRARNRSTLTLTLRQLQLHILLIQLRCESPSLLDLFFRGAIPTKIRVLHTFIHRIQIYAAESAASE